MIKSGLRAFWTLRNYLTSTKIDLKFRLRLFNMCVLSTLTYGSDTWTLTARNKQRLRVSHLAMLRRILRESRRDHIPNVEIFKKCDATPLSSVVKSRKWSWAGHLARRSDGRWSEAVTCWWPRGTGARRRGGQKKRWKDEFKIVADWWRQAREKKPVPATPQRPRRARGGQRPSADSPG